MFFSCVDVNVLNPDNSNKNDKEEKEKPVDEPQKTNGTFSYNLPTPVVVEGITNSPRVIRASANISNEGVPAYVKSLTVMADYDQVNYGMQINTFNFVEDESLPSAMNLKGIYLGKNNFIAATHSSIAYVNKVNNLNDDDAINEFITNIDPVAAFCSKTVNNFIITENFHIDFGELPIVTGVVRIVVKSHPKYYSRVTVSRLVHSPKETMILDLNGEDEGSYVIVDKADRFTNPKISKGITINEQVPVYTYDLGLKIEYSENGHNYTTLDDNYIIKLKAGKICPYTIKLDEEKTDGNITVSFDVMELDENKDIIITVLK